MRGVVLSVFSLGLWSLPAAAQDATDVEETPATEEASPEAVEESPPYPVTYKGQATPETSQHWDLEVMYHESRHEEGYKAAKARYTANPNDIEAAWHTTRFMFEIGELIDRTETGMDKDSFYMEMRTIADASHAVNSNDTHLKFAKGVAIGRWGTHKGVIASLFLADDLEDVWLDAADDEGHYSSIGGEEQLPCDIYHGLGIFYRLVPDYWIVKLIAGTKGDLQKSLDYHMKSNTTCPGRISPTKELAATQICLGQSNRDEALIAEGNASLKRVLTIEATSDKDKLDHRHAKLMLADNDMACGYSRDGQQDLDTEKIEQ